MNSDKYLFTPLDYVHLIMKRWWLLVVFVFLGVAAGWLFHSLRGPVYEARAEITSSIDFSKTGELSELQEDMAVVLIGDVIKSSPVITEVISSASSQGLTIDLEEFSKNKFLERSNNHWVLIIRWEDPERTAQLANLWADYCNAVPG